MFDHPQGEQQKKKGDIRPKEKGVIFAYSAGAQRLSQARCISGRRAGLQRVRQAYSACCRRDDVRSPKKKEKIQRLSQAR
jgi:hypothetical protein